MQQEEFQPSGPPYETILIEKKGPVDWVTLNRPERLNALSTKMMLELQHYFGALYNDNTVRLVVLKGAGRAFCAGLDLKENGERREKGERPSGVSYGMRSQRRVSEIIMKMRRCPQPIISLIQGAASGGGFAMALASDVRYAGESARMNAAFIRIGLSACDVGVSYFLPRLVGASVASELLLTGRFIHADRALRTGLVSDVVPDEELETVADELIQEMLTTTPLGLRLTKEAINMSIDANSLESVIAMEDRQQILCAQGADFREGVGAFLEKRDPVYQDK
ncbi:MAG: enoyl-CoA hydratase/isomerase family protein [Pseudomonadota bacterium]